MKKLIIIALTIIIITNVYQSNLNSAIQIPNEAIRLRIIANSNTLEDQQIKLSIKSDIQEYLSQNLVINDSIEKTREKIELSIDPLKQIIDDKLTNYNNPYSYKISYGYNYFPEKTFQNKTYEEGLYESLVITLGAGAGENWWCVLFPPMCLMETNETSKENVEYEFFLTKIIASIFN